MSHLNVNVNLSSNALSAYANSNFNVNSMFAFHPENEVRLRSGEGFLSRGRVMGLQPIPEESDIVFIPFGLAKRAGRTINYATVRNLERFSSGMGRFEMFFNMLNRVGALTYRGYEAIRYYGVHITFQDLSDLPEEYRMGTAIASNFGLSGDDDVLYDQFDDTKWPYDIMKVYDMEENGRMSRTTPLIKRGGGMGRITSREEFVNGLKREAMKILPVGADSRANDGSWRIINLFLVVYRANIRGGHPDIITEEEFDMLEIGVEEEKEVENDTLLPLSVLDDISDSFPDWSKILSSTDDATASKGVVKVLKRKREISSGFVLSTRSVFFPPNYDKGDEYCFLYCLLYALSLMIEHKRVDDSVWWWKYAFNITTMKSTFMKNVCTRARKQASEFIHDFCSRFDFEEARWYNVALTDVSVIMGYFGMSEDDFCVIDKDGDVLMGSTRDLMKIHPSDGKMMFCLVNRHYGFVMSYTAFLNVKVCYRCKGVFHSTCALSAHLQLGRCMKCACKKVFESESEFFSHKANPSECDFSYEMHHFDPEMALKRIFLRFPHDEKEKSYRKNMGVSLTETLLMSQDDIHTGKSAVFFDLETLVPSNKGIQSRDEFKKQTPYAAGWIRSEDVGVKEVTIAYGLDCMQSFISYLDEWYEEIVDNEKKYFYNLAKACYEMDRVPRKIKGNLNMTARLQRCLITMFSQDVCPICRLHRSDHRIEVEGEECIQIPECVFLQYASNAAEKNIITNGNDHAPSVSIYAHNGGKFDWIFLHRFFMENGRMNELEIIRAGSKYIRLTYKNVFHFRDSLLFLSGSLDSLAKAFRVNTMKGMFPYAFMENESCMHEVVEGESEIRRRLPPSFFKTSKEIKGPMKLVKKVPLSDFEYEEMWLMKMWRFDVKEETIMYLRDDVMCLAEIMMKFREGWEKMPFSPQLFMHDTIGQLSHEYFLKRFLSRKMYPVLDVCEDSFIRGALYGGRTEVFRRFPTERLPIHYVDVNSLYPYVMETFSLPCGDPVWHILEGHRDEFTRDLAISKLMPFCVTENQSYFDMLVTRMNDPHCNDDYGFMKVDVVCPSNLMYPVLPEREVVNGSEKNMFSLKTKVGVTYFTEELKYAVRRGYKVTKVYCFSEWKKAPIYKDIIHVLKEQKMLGEGKDVNGNPIPGVEKNVALRTASKLAQNSLFGKTIQNITESCSLVDNRETLFALIEKGSRVTVTPIFRSDVADVVEVRSKQESRIQKKSCCAIGTAILSHARMVLYDYFEIALKVGGEILYCDTDSIVFTGEKGLPVECLDDSLYGKMKVEIPCEDIVDGGFVALSPKCYAFQLRDGSPYIRCKGVNLGGNVVVEDLEVEEGLGPMFHLIQEMEREEGEVREGEVKGISFEHLDGLVRGRVNCIITDTLQFYKSKDLTVAAVEIMKVLKDNFDKRRLLENGETVPWNDLHAHVLHMDGNLIDDNMLERFMHENHWMDVADYFIKRKGIPYFEGALHTFLYERTTFESWYFRTMCETHPLYVRLVVN